MTTATSATVQRVAARGRGVVGSDRRGDLRRCGAWRAFASAPAARRGLGLGGDSDGGGSGGGGSLRRIASSAAPRARRAPSLTGSSSARTVTPMRTIVGGRHSDVAIRREALLAEEHAVLRAEIAEEDLRAAPHDLHVLARRVRVGERQIAGLGAADRRRRDLPPRARSSRPMSGPSTTRTFATRVVADAHPSRCARARARDRAWRGRGRGVGALLSDRELEPHAPDAHEIARLHERAASAARASRRRQGAVRAALVDDRVVAALRADARVAMAHARVGQAHVAAVAAADDDARAVERERRRVPPLADRTTTVTTASRR